MINHLTNSAIPLKITFQNMNKKQLPYLAIHIFYFLFFHFDVKDVINYIVISSKFVHFLWKPFFPGSDTRPT